MWCIPAITQEFIERMNDVLDLYARPYNANEPVLCFDEKSKELHKEMRTMVRAKEGRPCRRDYEYQRNGTCNIFMSVEPKGGHRDTTVTLRRTRIDFAEEIKRVIQLPRYRGAACIHIVLDNLNTHNEQSLEMAFGTAEAGILMRRMQFHHTPKHASWLNMAEIELSVMERQCTNTRIPDMATLAQKLRSWEERRNADGATISWTFTREDARRVFHIRGQN